MKFFKNIKKGYFVVALVFILSFLLIHIVQAVASQPAEPGTDGDPLVTQGYVDKKIADSQVAVSSLTSKTDELSTKTDGLISQADDLTKKVNDLTSQAADLANKVSDLTEKLNSLTTVVSSINTDTGSEAQDAAGFKFIPVEKGKQLIAGEGTEIVLRSGSAKAINGSAGLADVTSGKDLTAGSAIGLNHLLISAKNDGRGLKAVNKVWLLVKGTYTIK